MKIITFTVPCYNSAAYMKKCIDSLLASGTEDEIEIIIVNDGSTDDTYQIAEQYKKDFPKIIKIVHQENGGHGEGVNQGIKNASGYYFKVVDSDDWLDSTSAKQLIQKMKHEIQTSDNPVDLFIANYVYEHQISNKQRVMKFDNVFPQNKKCTWDDVKYFNISQYIIMHTLYYRTQVIKDAKLVLPKHTFYVDNIFAYVPLPYVKTIYYMNANIYRYFIGREDQTVNENNMIKNIDQQFKITEIMIEAYSEAELNNVPKKLKKYMCNYLQIIMAISISLTCLDDTAENVQREEHMWFLLKEKMPTWYKKIKYRSMLIISNIPEKIGRPLTVMGYRIAQKVYKFN